MFLSFTDGMETLVRKLLISLVQVRIRTSTKVKEVRSEVGGWQVMLEDGSKMEADLLCLALPGTQAARILKSTDAALAGSLEQIPYRSMTTLHLGLRSTSLLRPYNQYGFMISPEKASAVLSASFASNKFVNRAPGDFHQIRVFGVEGLMQGKGAEAERLAGQKLWDEMTKILDIVDSQPSVSALTHWEEAIPRYRLGHLEQVARIEIEAARRPSLFLTGNAFRGVGISDCVRQAEETAQKMIAFLKLGSKAAESVENSEPFLPTCCG
jgi:oxygen-dependent protoporphyrinogen oxidase